VLGFGAAHGARQFVFVGLEFFGEGAKAGESVFEGPYERLRVEGRC